METNTTNNINWDELEKQYKESGVGLKRWCELNNVSFYKMKYHLYDAKKHKTHKPSNKVVPLIKVIPEKQETVNNTIDINIGKASITVDGNTDLQLLSKIMEVLA